MKKALLMMGVALVAAGANAAIITTADGNGADTFVGNDSNKAPTSNYGTNTGLDLRIWTDVRAHLAYVKFDLSSIVSGDLHGAQLSLYITQSGATRDFLVYGLNDNAVDDAWGETSITYNTAPGMAAATTGNYAIDGAKLTSLGTVNVSGTGAATSLTSSLDLDSFLDSDSDGLVTFVFIPNDTGGKQFYAATKEDGVNPAPSLILPNAVIPEPATFALFAAMGGGILFIRRRLCM